MFVSAGARELLLARRRDEFRTLYVRPLLREAGVLAISTADLHSMIDEPDKEPT